MYNDTWNWNSIYVNVTYVWWSYNHYIMYITHHTFNLLQSLSHIQLFETPWTAAHQAPLSSTISWSLIKLMPIKSVMPSNHLILCQLLLLLPSIFPSTKVFSNESILCIKWQCIGASASVWVLSMNIQGWFPLIWTSLISLQPKGLSRVFSNTAVQNHQFLGISFLMVQLSHPYWLLGKP